MKYRIGCSGYYYQQWKNKFYPEGLQPKNWLQHYSSVFNTVELNGSFYRVPKLSDLKKYAKVTPDDFTFSVKVNRLITHIHRLKEKDSVIEFQNTIWEGLESKLSYFLFQMPPSFHYNEENLERILNNIPHEPHNVIELRHISWWNNTVTDAFAKAKLTFCNVDFPNLDSSIVKTSPEFYLRLHGNPELFITPYSTHQLQQFVHQFPENCKHHTVYFNNTMYDAAYRNAQELMRIVMNTEV